MMSRFLSLIILVGCLISCDKVKEFVGNKEEADDGLVRIYHDNGKLKFICGVDSLNKRHGEARSYSEKGIIQTKIIYDHGVKTKAVSYYENGNPRLDISYVNGQKEGVRKKYYQNGKLESEQEYHNDDPVAGLKEYTKNGQLRSAYPELVIKPIDKISRTGEYIIQVYFSKNSKRGTYYLGSLKDGKYLSSSLLKLPVKDARGFYVYTLPPGAYLMEKISFVGVYKTPMGNTYLTQKFFNLAIENPY